MLAYLGINNFPAYVAIMYFWQGIYRNQFENLIKESSKGYDIIQGTNIEKAFSYLNSAQ